VEPELTDVLHRPKLARFIDPSLRTDVLGILLTQAVRFEPVVTVADPSSRLPIGVKPRTISIWNQRSRPMPIPSYRAMPICSI
jgi:hypothetical protein